MKKCNCGASERAGAKASGLLAAFLTGAGLAATAFVLAGRLRHGYEVLCVDDLLDRCDEAALMLDSRLEAAG